MRFKKPSVATLAADAVSSSSLDRASSSFGGSCSSCHPDPGPQASRPWTFATSLCADCPRCLVLAAAAAPPPPAFQIRIAAQLASASKNGTLDIRLDLLPADPSEPPVQERDAQHKFVQHKGAHAPVDHKMAGSLLIH